eukprot:7960527-Lingulodinium_polyedra.AAC.1
MSQFETWQQVMTRLKLPQECLQGNRASKKRNDIDRDEYAASTIGMVTLLTRWASTLKGAGEKLQAKSTLAAICAAGLPASWPLFLSTNIKELDPTNVVPEGIDKMDVMVP